MVKLIVEPAQLSVTVGAVQIAVWEHVNGVPPAVVLVMDEGQPLIAGAILSDTVTVNVHVDELPEGSEAV